MKMERMQTPGRLRGLGGEIYEALSCRSFQGRGKKKRRRKKNPSSFRWLEIRLAAESRDLILPGCTREGLLSQDVAETLGRGFLCGSKWLSAVLQAQERISLGESPTLLLPWLLCRAGGML